ncbi:MAG TPA: TIGR01459 family HAD-type hydrolase [Pseudolabrys sp.]|nr:TIGR01459 family HAD-type hydrolase [Pseudolabrys sp.]
MSTAAPPLVPHFAAFAPGYDLVLCDVWGVVHNGVSAFSAACDALNRFRGGGGTVILITNSPRPSDSVARQLDRLQVPRGVYDAMVSSGDVTRGVILARPNQALFHLGPERDRSVFAGLNLEFSPLEHADYVVCTGLEDDERETPDDYRQRLEAMRTRDLLMVCGNPDVVVERGTRLVYCAGALADLYAGMGGEVLYAGKPYRPIYEMSMAKAQAARGGKISLGRTLAIGDSLRTDLRGAHDFGVDVLFVTSGIHADEFGLRESPDLEALNSAFDQAGLLPQAITPRLVW